MSPRNRESRILKQHEAAEAAISTSPLSESLDSQRGGRSLFVRHGIDSESRLVKIQSHDTLSGFARLHFTCSLTSSPITCLVIGNKSTYELHAPNRQCKPGTIQYEYINIFLSPCHHYKYLGVNSSPRFCLSASFDSSCPFYAFKRRYMQRRFLLCASIAVVASARPLTYAERTPS